ncbi:cilia- and flagella-associated protein 276 isoform X1 [Lepidochelys kempii]|uniref:cilia- and flagella-associated protein 276 isoform X1 n=1 Tax=Lepidochelys kempii TaxID=8472 RepID=UPI003C7006AC
MPPTRDPFPCPRCENEDTFTGRAGPSQTGPYAEPTHRAQQQDPWNRLHRTATLSSTRKEVWYTEPEVPRDSLDFKLTSLYNHHKEQLRDKSQTVIHKETLLDDHGSARGHNQNAGGMVLGAGTYLVRAGLCPRECRIWNSNASPAPPAYSRALKGLEPVKEPEPPPVEHRTARGLSVRCWVSPTKESIHSIEGAIECPHTAATNSGYSRKENGSFFSQ